MDKKSLARKQIEQVRKEDNKIIKYLFIFLAINLIGVAVALILESRLGCDPIALLCDGISQLLSVQFGIASFIYNVLIIGVALLVGRKNLGMGTIVYGLLAGFFIDFYRGILSGFALADRGIVIAIIIFLIGEILMAAAFSILMELQLGMTALDAVLVKIQQKTHISYTILKIATDICLVVTGIILGGTFGIGTIVSACVTGLLVTQWAKVIGLAKNKIQNKI